MEYIGLLTDEQKRGGYFVSQDPDFIYVWHRDSGRPRNIAVLLFDTTTIKEVRELTQADLEKHD